MRRDCGRSRTFPSERETRQSALRKEGLTLRGVFVICDYNYMIKYYFIDITAVMLVTLIIIFIVVCIKK